MRLAVARALVWAAVVIWAVWTGGQTYHAMMVIPVWSADPTTVIPSYTALGRGANTQPFFLWFSTVWPTVFTAVALMLTRKAPVAYRSHLVAFTTGAFLISGALILWMAPTIGTVMREPSLSSEAVETFRRWETANLIRLLAELALLPVGIRGLIGLYMSGATLARNVRQQEI
jgi:hypothetical protein